MLKSESICAEIRVNWWWKNCLLIELVHWENSCDSLTNSLFFHHRLDLSQARFLHHRLKSSRAISYQPECYAYRTCHVRKVRSCNYSADSTTYCKSPATIVMEADSYRFSPLTDGTLHQIQDFKTNNVLYSKCLDTTARPSFCRSSFDR